MPISIFSKFVAAISRHHVSAMAVITLAVGVGALGCHDLVGSQSLPPGTQDPSYYATATGALGMRNAALISFGAELPDYIVNAGLLTDELTDVSTFLYTPGSAVGSTQGINNPLDERILPELSYGSTGRYASDVTYDYLQGIRAALSQAIGQLTVSDVSAKDTIILPPAVDSVLRGELYALYGYSEVMLADFFCSGIPLSTLDFQHDFTYRGGSPAAQVYQDAIAKFDTAVALSVDSTRIENLARVGLGRAYLDLGNFAAAADDVSGVSTDFQYQFIESWHSQAMYSASCAGNFLLQASVLGNVEGAHGLPYSSRGDPRTAVIPDSVCYNTLNGSENFVMNYPRVYTNGRLGGDAPVTIASGVEARLIEAEAALQPGGAGVSRWLMLLNTLRQTAPMPGVNAPLPDQMDSLPLLSDPGTDSARIALTFQERAAWLYLTGHRQGDLRRQLRQYARYWSDQSLVYPSGVYTGLGIGNYGTDVAAPIPQSEYINPLFHGCVSRAP